MVASPRGIEPHSDGLSANAVGYMSNEFIYFASDFWINPFYRFCNRQQANVHVFFGDGHGRGRIDEVPELGR